ncbi:MAG: homoserine kinase [Clostridiaceae bacterium]|nr:homoserine kinase [Clostridiaceae bacterium]
MITIRVPATSANLGPGFDCLGIALNLYNTFDFEEIDKGIEFIGCAEKFKNKNNLVYTSMKKCFEKIGYKSHGIRIKMQCDIPVSRGLGSSAACILGGVMAASEIAAGALSKNEILEIASEIEGHPDNLAPALYGGMAVSIKDEKSIYVQQIKLNSKFKLCALIPSFTLSTEKARSVLPTVIPYEDALFNIGRTALLIAALSNGNMDMISIGCEDKLHQKHRGNLINNYEEITKKCMELNSKGVFLSGAGPTIMNIINEENAEFEVEIVEYLSVLKDKWVVKQLDIDYKGAITYK